MENGKSSMELLNMPVKTILFVSHSALLYGAERCLLDLVLNLPARIHPVVLLPSHGPLTDVLSENDIDYYVVPFRGWTGRKWCFLKTAYRFLSNIGAYIKILRTLKTLQIDMVYINTLCAPIGALLSISFRVPLVWHFHEFVSRDSGIKFDYGIDISMKAVCKYADLVVCNSKALKKNISQFIPAEKISVVYNGMLNKLDNKSLSGSKRLQPGKTTSLVIIGSIENNKNQADAIKAVNELVKMGKNVELKIVGNGDAAYIRNLKNIVIEMGVTGRIKWEGFRENVTDYYISADIALVCSQFETFGRVVVEAMSTGCPVVATNTGGIPEIINNGYNGLLYKPGDFCGLAINIANLIDDDKLYSQISKNAIDSSYSRFDREKYVEALVGLCDAVMTETRRTTKEKD